MEKKAREIGMAKEGEILIRISDEKKEKKVEEKENGK